LRKELPMTPDEITQELERLALSEATSGRRALAKVTALPMLERLDRRSKRAIPVDDEGRFHPRWA
jgi:hypothetical protein